MYNEKEIIKLENGFKGFIPQLLKSLDRVEEIQVSEKS